MTLFFTALIVGYSGAMMPGPLLTYNIEQSIRYGWKRGLLVPLGHILIEMALVLLIALGLGNFLNNPVPKIVLFLLGGVILLWFGFDMIWNAFGQKGFDPDINIESCEKSGTGKVLVKSGIISVLNPYFLIWWATVGMGFIVSSGGMDIKNIGVFYIGHAMADISWYFLVAILCNKIRSFINGIAYRIIIGALGGLLVFFASRFIYDGLKLIVGLL